MKKLITLFILLQACCMNIWAYSFVHNNIYYNIISSTDKEVEVTFKTRYSATDTYTGDITIPESVTYDNTTYKVTRIGECAFCWGCKVEKISLPSTIKTLSQGAFSRCNLLTSVTTRGNSNIESLGSSTFFECIELQNVPDFSKVTGTIHNDVFYNCYKLESVNFSSKITEIKDRTFYKCSSLKNAGDLSCLSSVGEWAFLGCSNLKFNTNLSKITHIGSSAFGGCEQLERIDLSNVKTFVIKSNTSSAFAGCTSLKTVTYPAQITTIPSNIFSGCINLETVVFTNDNITSIESCAFNNCHKLTTFPNISKVETIGSGAFNQCYSLQIERLTIPDVTTSIGMEAFMGCSGIRHLSLGNGITSIPQRAFANQTGKGAEIASEDYKLESITFGNNLKAIVDEAFISCTNLKEIVTPASLERIGTNAFLNCKNLALADLSNSTKLTVIEKKVFSGCSSFFHIDYPQKTDNSSKNKLNREFGNKNILILPSSIETIEDYAFSNCVNLEDVSLSSSVKEIGSNAFQGCNNLTSFAMESSSMNEIKDYAFDGCSGLTSVKISSNITRIGKCAFRNCTGLTSLNIPNSVKTIDKEAFKDCKGLTSINIPARIATLGESAFYGCEGLTAVHIPNIETWCNFSFERRYDNPLYYAKHLFLNGEEVTDLVIPSSIKNINNYLFYDCDGLTSVSMNDSITTIGEYAFYDCDELTSVNIPDSVTTIGYCAFRNCNSLTSINIPTRIDSIAEHAFYGCEGLTAVHIPNIETWCNLSFESSYDNPLYYAKHLFLNREEIKELVIPNSIKNINNYLFYNCEGLTSVSIPESVTSIGDYAFNGCSSLTSVHMPDSLTAIGDYAFDGCKGLTTIYIPKNLTSIGENAFSWCYNIENIYSFAKVPISCEENIFTSTVYNYATLHVPAGSESSYSQTTPWNKFKIKSIPTSIENTILGDKDLENVDVYTTDGNLFKKSFNFKNNAKELPSNIYIINGKKYLVK